MVLGLVPSVRCRTRPYDGDGAGPSPSDRCVSFALGKSARVAAGFWYNDSAVAKLTARSQAKRWSEESTAHKSDAQVHCKARTVYITECTNPWKNHCHASPATYMQVGCGLPRTSLKLPQWNPPASLDTLYTVNFQIQCYAARSSPKRLIGTLQLHPTSNPNLSH